MSAINRDGPPTVALHTQRPVYVSVAQWGPTWKRMQAVAKWLGSLGISYELETDGERYDPDKGGLPQLVLYTPNWDSIDVRIGWYITVYPSGQVRVLSPQQVEEELEGPHRVEPLEPGWAWDHEEKKLVRGE